MVYLREKTYPILALAISEVDPLPWLPFSCLLAVIAVSCGAELPPCGQLFNLLALQRESFSSNSPDRGVCWNLRDVGVRLWLCIPREFQSHQ